MSVADHEGLRSGGASGGAMLQGKCAIVTGSTSGIGLGIARGLAAQGASVMLNGFGERTQIERLMADLGAEREIKVAYDGADMSKPKEVAGMVEHAARELGGVDILVNNAGIQHTARIEEFPPEKWDAIIGINLSAPFHAIRTALPHMRRRGWGRIVNIASTHGLVASLHKAAYVAAKHGILGLTKVVALETATTSITCNAICPGWVLTPLIEKQVDDWAERDGISKDQARMKLLGEKQPSLEFATPEQISAAALFLCSEGAAQIRGVALPVDGGWTAQ